MGSDHMKPRKKKLKGVFMKIILALIIVQVIVYTWLHLYLSYKVGMEIAPSATIGFYGFCGIEAGICGWIKNSKKEGTMYEESGGLEAEIGEP